jgi:hypothetical protein
MFTAAPKVKNTFDEILDKDKGLSVAIGASVVDMSKPNADFDEALNSKGDVVILGTIKGRERSQEKVTVDYDGDWSQLKDVVRGTVAVGTVQQIPQAVEKLHAEMSKKGYTLLQQPKNNYETPMKTGYRDINLVYKSPNGFPMEIQVNTKEMLKAKQGDGHKYYEEIRTIEDKLKTEKRLATSDEAKRLSNLYDASQKLYNAAYEKSLG